MSQTASCHLQLLLQPQTQQTLTENFSFRRSETAVIKVTMNMLSALDSDNVSAFTLFDLSAAFDTIDHSLFAQTVRKDPDCLCRCSDILPCSTFLWDIQMFNTRPHCIHSVHETTFIMHPFSPYFLISYMLTTLWTKINLHIKQP